MHIDSATSRHTDSYGLLKYRFTLPPRSPSGLLLSTFISLRHDHRRICCSCATGRFDIIARPCYSLFRLQALSQGFRAEVRQFFLFEKLGTTVPPYPPSLVWTAVDQLPLWRPDKIGM